MADDGFSSRDRTDFGHLIHQVEICNCWDVLARHVDDQDITYDPDDLNARISRACCNLSILDLNKNT